MFYQGKNRADDAQGGLGLGLALVRRLIELHGGSVQAHSAGLDQGSEFEVRIPAVSTSTWAPPGTDSHPSTARPPRRRILVADDNRDAAETLATILRLEGNDVDVAYDGADAVLAMSKFQPDVVLMDLGMPKLDGHAAARAIRSVPREQVGGPYRHLRLGRRCRTGSSRSRLASTGTW